MNFANVWNAAAMPVSIRTQKRPSVTKQTVEFEKARAAFGRLQSFAVSCAIRPQAAVQPIRVKARIAAIADINQLGVH
jgi:hypothetical protein